jgi:hypothetical protein
MLGAFYGHLLEKPGLYLDEMAELFHDDFDVVASNAPAFFHFPRLQ